MMSQNLWRSLVRLCLLAMAAVFNLTANAQLPGAQAEQLSQNTDQRVIVIMQSQHAVAPGGTSAMAERSNIIAAEQAPMMDELRQVGATNIKSYRLVNAFSATVSTDYVARLKANPAVAAVIPDSVIRRSRPVAASAVTESAQPAVAASIPPHVLPGACGANGAVQLESEGLALTSTDSDNPHALTARSLGITGEGVKVAWIADGIDPNNINFIRPDHTSVFVDFQDFSGDGPGQLTSGGEAFLDANTIAGQGIHVYNVRNYSLQAYPTACKIRIEGVAPGASLVGLDVFGTFEDTTTSSFLQAIEYAVQTAHVDVINESFGSNPFPDITAMDAIARFDEAAVAAGVVVTVSSGDAGPFNTIGSPASDSHVISVGGTTDLRSYAQTNYAGSRYFATTGWLDNNISMLSSSGFTEAGGTIDIVAPGDESFVSCDASPEFADCVNDLGQPSDVSLSGGTSESSPFIAGAAALVIQAYRQTHGGSSPTPALVKKILLSTAADIGAPAQQQGAGLLNSYKAVLLAKSIHTGDGSPKRVGNTLLTSTNQLNATDFPSSPKTWNVTVTNSGASPQSVDVISRKVGPDQLVQTGKVTLKTGTSKTFIGWQGATYNYKSISFIVPPSANRLDVSISNAQITNTVRLILIDPKGRFAGHSIPQGLAQFGNLDVDAPVSGTWTGIIFSAGSPGNVLWRAATQRFIPFASVEPANLVLRPGESKTVRVSANTPPRPGDAAGSIVLFSDRGTGGITSIPVTLRSLIDVSHGGAFSGILTGGNGRGSYGQEQYYKFEVPRGVLNITANVSLKNDLKNPVGAYLISPDGDTLGYGQNSLNGAPTSLTAYTLNPVPGTWSLVLDFAEPTVGNEISETFTGNIRFNRVSASAAGLPNSAGIKLAAGTPVTIPITITNHGAAPEDFFIDARLDKTTALVLAPLNQATDLTLPLAGNPPFWLVPTQTSSLALRQTSSIPTMFDFGPNPGNPDLTNSRTAKCSRTPQASYTPRGGSVTAGVWYAFPNECGPYVGPAPVGTASLALTAHTKAFDRAVTSGPGDLWPSAQVTPVVIGSGQTATIHVTIKPVGPSGTVVHGTLYVDDLVSNVPPYGQFAGDELAAFPYTYTIK